MGQDVEWAKSVISQKLGCQMKDLVFFFNKERMIDIFSLCDVKGLKDNSLIEVQVF